jgi:hypothetical protein
VLRHARTHHKYKDQTGNLTSSIGYCILDNGRVIRQSTFEIDTEATTEVRKSKNFKRAQAKVYEFLADAPNVSQGGISFGFTDDERRRFRLKAGNLLDEVGDNNNSGIEYGYMGGDL